MSRSLTGCARHIGCNFDTSEEDGVGSLILICIYLTSVFGQQLCKRKKNTGDYVSHLVPSFACTTGYSHLITSKKNNMHAIFQISGKCVSRMFTNFVILSFMVECYSYTYAALLNISSNYLNHDSFCRYCC